jgi:hypothetical protein
MSYPRTTSIEFLDRCSPATAAFYRYWDGARRGRPMPARADLDPLEMKPWLPGLILVDVKRNPFRLVYRLVGERSVEVRGFSPTGKTVEEGFHGTVLAEVLENYRLVVEEKKLVYDWDSLPSASGLLCNAGVLLLPLSSDGDTVDMVVAYLETAPAR